METKSSGITSRTERFYVKVISEFDSTGYMFFLFIIWVDGCNFAIEKVRDFRPAKTESCTRSVDCFTVLIHGQVKFLFFEHADPLLKGTFGRWYVEKPVV